VSQEKDQGVHHAASQRFFFTVNFTLVSFDAGTHRSIASAQEAPHWTCCCHV